MTPAEYFALGYGLFPCRWDKRPTTPASTPEKEGGFHWAVCTEAELDDLQDRFPGPNLGMKIPIGVLVIDLDIDPKAGKQGIQAMQAINPEFDPLAWPGPIQKTPKGGYHLFCLCPPGVTGNSPGSLPYGVDLRGNGKGYTCVFPSVTEDGAYQWIQPLVDPLDLPPCPEWITKLILKPKHEPKAPKVRPSGSFDGECKGSECERWRKRAAAWSAKAFDGMVEGMANPPRRHDYLLHSCIKIGAMIAGGICTQEEGEEAVNRVADASSRKMPEKDRCKRDGFRYGSDSPKRLDRCESCLYDRRAKSEPKPAREPGCDDDAEPSIVIHPDTIPPAVPVAAVAWPEAQPLPSRSHPAPPLDPMLLPDSLRAWIVDAAAVASMPLCYVAVPAMVALGTVVGRRVGICPEVYEPQWSVKGNLWGVIVGNSGQRKSSAIRKGLMHLRPIERDMMADWEQVGPGIEAQRIALEKIKKGGKGIDEHDQEDAIRKLKLLPSGARRLRTNDATVEKLAMMLGDNPDGILMERDELSAWMKMMDMKGREGERGFYLEGWAGDGSYVQDRVSRGTLHLQGICLSVIGTLQPGPLTEYLSGATAGGAKADGMLQRLQLLVWPDAAPEFHKADRFPDEGASQRAEGVYGWIHRAKPSALGASLRHPSARVPCLVFDTPAQSIYDRWHEDFERRLVGEEISERSAMGSHLSKYRSLVPKLALLLHLADNRGGSQVGELATLRAVAWVEWLEHHARKVYAPEEPARILSARALAEKIKTGAVGDGTTVRDIYRYEWKRLDDRAKVDGAIKELEKLGWIRQQTKPTKGRMRIELAINPVLP